MQILYNISKVVLFLLLIVACSQQKEGEKKESKSEWQGDQQVDDTPKNAWYADKYTIQGKAQGTTFVIKTSDDSLYLTPKESADFFAEFDEELSTYKEKSLISKINSNDLVALQIGETKYFKSAINLSKEVADNTSGAFDPTVFPLVEMWGFFKNPHDPPESAAIDSVLQFVGFLDTACFKVDKEGLLIKTDQRAQLDFNAIAQGQSVDEIAAILEERGQQNYFIEVGGEIRAKGKNDRGTEWVIGIDEPTENNNGVSSQRKLENYLSIADNAVATSGSYRKFYVKDGQKYSHTIDPKTGRPVQHNLLSVTVVAENAAVADAYATAFMAMGVDESLRFVKENPNLNLHIYLLFENKSGRIERAYSKGMSEYFIQK